MSANGDWLRPTRNQTGDVLADDWLAEHSAAQDVPDGSVWALPHLLQLELCGTSRRKTFRPGLWTLVMTSTLIQLI